VKPRPADLLYALVADAGEQEAVALLAAVGWERIEPRSDT